MENISKVYFTNLHTTPRYNLLKKLRCLLVEAGFEQLDLNKKMVALKIHFGEPGNLAYIRPNYAAVVVKMVKEKNGLPFLTDANTLYKGRRANAIDHLQAAQENGFTPLTVGCNIIIADGLKGTDYREIRIDTPHCKTAKIASAIAEADVIISLNHFKGHEMSGFGGAVKNLGMGCGSVGGKLEMHSDSKPVIEAENCTSCKICINSCAHSAITLGSNKKAEIDYNKCVGCGQCIAVCSFNAAQVRWDSKSMQEKMAEYALAAVKGKQHFHVNFITNVSPHCDCWGMNDVPIVPDIGFTASFDPLAIDCASEQLVNAAPVNADSIIGKKHEKHADKFKEVFPLVDWRVGVKHAKKIGLGNIDFEMIKILEL